MEQKPESEIESSIVFVNALAGFRYVPDGKKFL